MRNNAAEARAVSKPRARKRTPSPAKVQRNEESRTKLIEAAGKTIGKYGYSGCSIARVTTRAKMAHGTFYLHFSSQKDLFDAVLPTLGASMLQVIGQAIHDAADLIDLERRGFQANFDYLTKHPYMYRVLTEAELYAPEAFQHHVDAMVGGYARSLRRSLPAGLADRVDAEELRTIATMLIGARTYLLMRYGVANNAVKPLPPGKLESYLKFVSHGLGAFGQAAPDGSADP